MEKNNSNNVSLKEKWEKIKQRNKCKRCMAKYLRGEKEIIPGTGKWELGPAGGAFEVFDWRKLSESEMLAKRERRCEVGRLVITNRTRSGIGLVTDFGKEGTCLFTPILKYGQDMMVRGAVIGGVPDVKE